MLHFTSSKWEQRFIAAEKRGGFSKYEVACSQSWGTCAIGERRQMLHLELTNDGDKLLMDHRGTLLKLGIDFMEAVKENQIARAKQLYMAISILMPTPDEQLIQTAEQIAAATSPQEVPHGAVAH